MEFIIPDIWSDEEDKRPSDDSDLDIEYLAPAAFIDQEEKKKHLTQVIKQMYNYAEVENHFADQDAKAKAKKEKE